MKRLLSLLLCLALLAAAGCTRLETVPQDAAQESEAVTPEPTETPVPAPQPGAYQGRLVAGRTHLIGLFEDGTVAAVGENDGMNGAPGCCDLDDWENIVAVSGGKHYTLGLKSDGSICLRGGGQPTERFQQEDWTGLSAVAAGRYHMAGLRDDGTVIAAGADSWGQLNVKDWTDIVAVAVGSEHTVGLKRDGTVMACGNNASGQCDAMAWTDIAAIAAYGDSTMGLKRDGTVVLANSGWSTEIQEAIAGWTDIVAVAAGSNLMGLKSDGHVLVLGYEDWDPRAEQIAAWENAVAVASGNNYEAALFADGTVEIAGNDWGGNMLEGVAAWNLFEAQPRQATPEPTAELAAAEVGGETYKVSTADWRSGFITLHFDEALTPEYIIVYPNGGSPDEGTRFDANTKLRVE